MSDLIPAEAVEAAAKWLHDIDCRSAVHSGHPADIECYGWKEEAKELLEVVAPHVRAAALREAAEAWGVAASWSDGRPSAEQVQRWLRSRANAFGPTP